MDSKLPRGFTRVSMLIFWPFRENLPLSTRPSRRRRRRIHRAASWG
jgi:hypothetical protein